MTVHQPIAAPDEAEVIDLYEMANVYPKRTGLPMTIWVSPRGRARHDVRIKVCRTHGERMDIDDTASVSVRPTPELVAGSLSASDLRVVQAWIMLNTGPLIEFWDGKLDSLDLAERLRRI